MDTEPKYVTKSLTLTYCAWMSRDWITAYLVSINSKYIKVRLHKRPEVLKEAGKLRIQWLKRDRWISCKTLHLSEGPNPIATLFISNKASLQDRQLFNDLFSSHMANQIGIFDEIVGHISG